MTDISRVRAERASVNRAGRWRQTGLTLVELMVTLAVLVILATLAYPMYTHLLLKSHRSEARVALSDIAMAEQRYFTVNGSFGSAADLGTAYTDAIGEMTDGNGDGNPDFYSIAVVSSTTSFSVTATATGLQADDGYCTSFTLDQLGRRTATGSDTDRCW